ncbi:MAG: methyltransferase domain-containing protein [Elusimicrobia bacterium]|nr:methyltransferase domain-containing protein [Elusimicrobiota bacterium]
MKGSLKTWLILIGVVIIIAGAGAYLTIYRTGRGRPERRAYRLADIAGKVASSQAVLAYLRAPGRETLQNALQTCLSTAERMPEDVFNGFLTAFCYHETGDAAGEARTLSKYRPEQKNMYKFCFYERRDELADALYFLPAYLCSKLRESPRARDSFPPRAKCPSFGGPIVKKDYQRGNNMIERFICPKCDGMIELSEKNFLGNIILHRVKKANLLVSILPSIATDLEDRRRFKGEKRNTVKNLIAAMDLREGMRLADIGCGVGQFTFPFAEKVGPKGKVYAEDIDAGMIKLIKYCADKGGLRNIAPVLGTPDDIKLPPGALDMATLIHIYRSIVIGLDEKGLQYLEPFFDTFLAGIYKALKSDGVLVLVDHFDPRFEISVETTAEALKKRNFRLVADKSDSRGRTMILFFKKTQTERNRL